MLLAHLGDREVPKQYAGVLGWFATNTSRDVAQSEVDGVGSFVAGELCELSFVGGDDDRCNGVILRN